MSGADGKTHELRPPSIKGVMRFWWRAVQAEGELCELKKNEAAIFGSSDAGRSKVAIRAVATLSHQNIKVLTHRDDETYGKTDSKGKIKKSVNDEGFHIGQKLEIRLNLTNEVKLTNGINFDDKMLGWLFKLTILLGGLGGRSRRGYGSIMIVEQAFISINKVIVNIDKLLNNLKPGYYKNERSAIKITKEPEQKEYPYIEKVEIGAQYNSYDELLKQIKKASSDYNDDALGYARNEKRLASPIYVSVVEISNKYHPVVTTLHNNANNKNVASFKKCILERKCE